MRYVAMRNSTQSCWPATKGTLQLRLKKNLCALVGGVLMLVLFFQYSISTYQQPLQKQPAPHVINRCQDTCLLSTLSPASADIPSRNKLLSVRRGGGGNVESAKNSTPLAGSGKNVLPSMCWDLYGLPGTEAYSVSPIATTSRSPFLPSFQNPCWRCKDGRDLRCLPYFYLTGFPKCGTTDMYRRMSIHPKLISAPVKEPHWITRLRFSDDALLNSTRFYTHFFARVLETASNNSFTNISSFVTGDGSASTIWDNKEWKTFPGNENRSEPHVINADYIRHLNPDVKIIVILRNPTDRLFSDYLYFTKANNSKEHFHRQVVRKLFLFRSCLETSPLRNCVYNVTLFQHCRMQLGLYVIFIHDWLLRFPRDQILVLRLEDIQTDIIAEMSKVFGFLGLDQPDEELRQKLNEMERQNAQSKKEDMMRKTRILLNMFYRPFNRALAILLKDNKYTWTDNVKE